MSRSRPPGTELTNGLVVASGSRLVGAVFYYPASEGVGLAARAVVSIERDPVGVYDEYVAQARRLGFLIGGSGTKGTCGLVFSDSPVTVPLSSPDPSTPLRLTCAGRGQRLSEPETLLAEMTWGGSSRHAVLSVGPADPIRDPDLGETRAATPSPLPKVSDAPLATEPGTPFGTRNNAFNAGYRRFKLGAGSRVAAELDNLTVLFIDGDARAVMRGYAGQLGGGRDQPKVERERTSHGDVLFLSHEPIGGGSATLFTDPTGKWLLIGTSSD